MADVKPHRRATLRAERAEGTRRRIAAAARTLFTNQGYGATTLAEIALEAGVAVQTVYAVYRSKAGILRALRDELVMQPEAEGLAAQAMADPDPHRALQLFARSIRIRWQHGHDVVAIHEQAAATDPTIRDEVMQVLSRRRGGLGRVAVSLAPGLAPGLDAEGATAILDALTLPEVYRQLTVAHGWTPDRYEAWLRAAMEQLLLAGRHGPQRVRRP